VPARIVTARHRPRYPDLRVTSILEFFMKSSRTLARGLCIASLVFALAACGGGGDAPPPGIPDAGDLGAPDLGAPDLGVPDLGATDLGADAGPTEFLASCEPCALDSDCGPAARCLALPSGQRACVPTCDVELPTCPRAFECTNAAAGGTYVCSPINGSCCIDEDADGYGDGIGCAGLDCNDVDLNVNPAAGEQCNNVDDDCDGTVDGFAADCGDQRCGETTTAGAYEEIGPGACEMGACVEGVRTTCGLYACEGGGSTGVRCASACTDSAGADDDSLCASRAHCEAGVCVDDVVDGGVCDEDTDCVGAHCDNGFCCDGGICCNAASDCPVAGGFISVCETPATCQGTTGAASCSDFICGTVSGVADDSGCTTEVIANECGFFLPVRCSGAREQFPPPCPSTCADDAECDAIAHCDTVCLPDLADGETCNEASDCTSGYCNNGICCSGGDCCVRPGDCPASYSNPPRCEAPEACQGSRDAAVCVGFVCNTMTNVPDDSACSGAVLANNCGSYPSRFCSGGTDQPAPMCAMSCTSDGECDADAHCDAGACVPDLEAGRMCDEASDCRSDYCNNGFCCGGGDCCSMASDCAAAVYGRPSTCTSATTCQGERVDPVCTASKQCAVGPSVSDDSGCVSLVADTCGTYPSVTCTSAADQTAPVCASMCASDADCDPTAFCSSGGVCTSRGMTGAACGSTSECATGLSCVDGVCCTSACTGTCRACNVAGSEGTCTNVPGSTDPDNECGAVSCAAYFTSPTGATIGGSCNQVANVPARDVFCTGSGTCQGAATLCAGRTVAGAEVRDCDNTCQILSGCTGTTPGRCDPYTPPSNTQSCGTGQCANTVPVCDAGALLTCTPRPSSAETCDDVDNDCDGQTDEGLSGDTLEPNNSCGAARGLAAMGTTNDGARVSIQTVTPTLYGAGDVDVYRVDWLENDSTCTCTPVCLNPAGCDEDYRLVATLTVPANAGSYQVCVRGGSTCGDGTCRTVAAGATLTQDAVIDGSCGLFGSDSGTYWVTVRGVGAPAFECSPYTLRVELQQACVGGN